MSLFDGVQNFTPAFTGQEIANQTGAGAASAFTGGMNAGTNKGQLQLGRDEFYFKKAQAGVGPNDDLKAFAKRTAADLEAMRKSWGF